MVKRLVDLLLAVLAALVLGLPLVLVAVLVKLTSAGDKWGQVRLDFRTFSPMQPAPGEFERLSGVGPRQLIEVIV